MAGAGDPEVLAAGPAEPARPATGLVPRPPRRAVAAALVLAAAAVLVAFLVGRVSTPAPSPAVTSSPGVVVPEVVDAETVPGTGGMVVRPVRLTSQGARYDYSLVGAPWLAPDGTVREGPPGCTRPTEAVQYVQVAVVHARPTQGGPAQDRVVWYRCRPTPFNP